MEPGSPSAITTPSEHLRPRPALFRALGDQDPPSVIAINNEPCELLELFKHDSWAATALYRGPTDKYVAKFNRQQPLLFLPAGWVGRWLARRERRAYHLLQDVPGIVRDAGEVRVGRRRCRHAVAHRYVEGHPLHMDERPSELFFVRLKQILAALHERGMAYGDLNKRENIIVTDNGEPVLVDFQIHFAPGRWALLLAPVRLLLTALQEGDRYHLHKHMLWHRPDLLPPEQQDLKSLQPKAVRVWRRVVDPFISFRRRLMVWLNIREGRGLAISEIAPEKAARLSLERKAVDPNASLPGER